MRLQVGKSKNARIIVDRTLPDSSYRLEYESTGSSAAYFLRSAALPDAVMTGLIGRPIAEVVQGMPDYRIVQRVLHSKKNGHEGIYLSVDTSLREFHSPAIDHRLDVEFHDRPMLFGGGRAMTLKDALSSEPDRKGARTYRRDRMDFAGLTFSREGIRTDYIAIQPKSSSKRPNLHLDGADRALPFDCYLVRADRAIPEQMAACAAASARTLINDDDFRAYLSSTIMRT